MICSSSESFNPFFFSISGGMETEDCRTNVYESIHKQKCIEYVHFYLSGKERTYIYISLSLARVQER